MQNHFLKFLIFFLFFFCFASISNAQISNFRLKQADSLFLAKRYTQSLEQYEKILKIGEFSPAMFLRMAFIEEGLQNPGKALYYLNVYYQATHDDDVVTKMESLAKKHQLTGYDATDRFVVLSRYKENHVYISLALCALVVLFISIAWHLKRKKQAYRTMAIPMVVLLLILGIHVFMGGAISPGIIQDDHVFIMDGPSPGASVVDVVNAGHRVEILQQHDVWVKILWNGEPAYVKEHQLASLSI
jgi:tetratricopeptide (TPR) repeat protein